MPLSDVDFDNLVWRTAARCNGGVCIEIAGATGSVAIRDSKNPGGPVLLFSSDEWRAFLTGAKEGDFDDIA